MPLWENFLVVSSYNVILGVYGLRENAVLQLRKIQSKDIHADIRIVPTTTVKRPEVGDIL
jgi:hypothetical protein